MPTFIELLSDPSRFLDDCEWSAPTILARLQADNHINNNRAVPDYPYLRGPKIGPLWLRMLRDNVGLEIKNLDMVPIPVDVHVARATFATGIVRGEYDGPTAGAYEVVRAAWRDSVQGLTAGEREMIALDLDEALWRCRWKGAPTVTSKPAIAHGTTDALRKTFA